LSSRTTTELLAAVRATPEDDAPRLVYADWLLQQGDPYGAFVAAQCRGEDDHALWAAHGAEWCAQFGLPREQLHFERGFVHKMTLRASDDWQRALGVGHPVRELEVELGERGLSRDTLRGVPLERLDLTARASTPAAALHELLGGPLPARLRLAFPSSETHRLLVTLAQSPEIERLRALSWVTSTVREDTLSLLLRRARGLQRLGLSLRIGQGFLEATSALCNLKSELVSLALAQVTDEPFLLLLWDPLRRLQRFACHGRCEVPGRLDRVWRGLGPELASLSVDGCRLTESLGALRHLGALREVKLVSAGLSGPVLASFAEAGLFVQAETLDLSGNAGCLRELDVVRQLARSRGRPRVLSLADSQLTDEGLAVLAEEGVLSRVHELDVRGTWLARTGALATLAPALQELHLSGGHTVEALCESPLPQRLQALTLSPSVGAGALHRLVGTDFPRLRSLSLQPFDLPAARALLERAPWWPALRRAQLSVSP
jgi:uncharacterized protein (TIGR02996 family)